MVKRQRELIAAAGDISVSSTGWPEVLGCVVVVFASRSGSTFFCRQVESRFRVSQVGEYLNARSLVRLTKRRGLSNTKDTLKLHVRENSEAKWFMCKAGGPGLASGELHGFFDEYMDRTSFIFLLRRSLVDQAISLFKANLTRQFHSSQQIVREVAEADFDRSEIARLLSTIVSSCNLLQRYLSASGRPTRAVVYEEFEDGDIGYVDKAMNAIGIPKREKPVVQENRQVTKLDREVNARWRERFLTKVDAKTAEVMANYARLFEVATREGPLG